MTKKPKWDGKKVTLMIQSNATSTRWVTHKLENNYITEVLLREWGLWAPCQIPQCGCLALGEELPEHLSLKASGTWSQKLHSWSVWIHSWRVHSRSCEHSGKGGKQWLHRGLGQTYLLVLEGLLERSGAPVAHCKDKDTGGRGTGENALAWTVLEAAILMSRPAPPRCCTSETNTTKK